MDELSQEIILVISSLLPLTALYIQGQAYFVPAVKMIGIQSGVIASLAIFYYFLTGDPDLLILGGILIFTRVFLTPYILLRVIKYRTWDRERVKVLSSFLINVTFFLSITLVLLYAVLIRVIPEQYLVLLPLILFFQGMFLIASRKSTTAHILGYVELENSLVVMGIILIPPPLIIDATVFLDVLGLVVISSVIIVEKRDHEPEEELVG
ncbi:MAG: hydrogenase [Metallosphaera sp.]|uniref:Hydrogenase 4 membrane component (E)-like protein n=1 Tax=Metallosphaera cuprina (strain Ar-4) TaxID=1006006 RepID=F4G219_METCR|nr:hydrogenase [Metallosphaera cuprina]AEB94908.1 hydrogenase 4 membrane component (E)-like protein [Metallosphaera cuprina Ar-4]